LNLLTARELFLYFSCSGIVLQAAGHIEYKSQKIGSYVLSMIIGMGLALPQGTREVILQGSITMAKTGCLVIAVITPIAFFASIGRSYLPAIGAIFILVALANIIAVEGWGMYFPWSVPSLYQGRLGMISA
jgi:hypothetical protein